MLEGLNLYEHDTPLARGEDGRWILVTLGELLRVFVDEGDDPVVLVRVVADYDVEAENAWARHYEVVKLPQGGIVTALEKSGMFDDPSILVLDEVQRMIDEGVIQ